MNEQGYRRRQVMFPEFEWQINARWAAEIHEPEQETLMNWELFKRVLQNQEDEFKNTLHRG